MCSGLVERAQAIPEYLPNVSYSKEIDVRNINLRGTEVEADNDRSRVRRPRACAPFTLCGRHGRGSVVEYGLIGNERELELLRRKERENGSEGCGRSHIGRGWLR